MRIVIIFYLGGKKNTCGNTGRGVYMQINEVRPESRAE